MQVSVIIPVWNGEKVIERCLHSVLSQKVQMEIIVVDDGSTDGTWEILQRMARQDERVRPVHQENGGVSAARNTGIAHSRGEYLRFVDADDVLPEGSMAALVHRAQEDRADLVLGAWCEVVGPARQHRSLCRKDETIPWEELLHRLSRHSNSFYYGALWNKLFRGDVVREKGVRFVGGLTWGEDFVFVCHYLAYVQRASYTAQAVYDYCRNGSGLTAHQFMDCLRHPWRNIRMKMEICRHYRVLYEKRGVKEKYRWVLWLYLVRVTLNQ